MVAAASASDGNFPGERYTVESTDNSTGEIGDSAVVSLSEEELTTLSKGDPFSGEVETILANHGMARNKQYDVMRPDGSIVTVATADDDMGTYIRQRA